MGVQKRGGGGRAKAWGGGGEHWAPVGLVLQNADGRPYYVEGSGLRRSHSSQGSLGLSVCLCVGGRGGGLVKGDGEDDLQ